MKKIIEVFRSANTLIAKAIRRAVKTAMASDFLLSASGIIAVGAVLVSPPPLWSIPLALSVYGVIVYGANILASSALGSIVNIAREIVGKSRRPATYTKDGKVYPEQDSQPATYTRDGKVYPERGRHAESVIPRVDSPPEIRWAEAI